MSASRQYDVVVWGATGYTGKLAAEHITKSLPTDLRWALAGRTESKLQAVADEIKPINPDRIQPGKLRSTSCVQRVSISFHPHEGSKIPYIYCSFSVLELR
jgi:hypothetical protein